MTIIAKLAFTKIKNILEISPKWGSGCLQKNEMCNNQRKPKGFDKDIVGKEVTYDIQYTGCFIMNATKVFSNNFYSKAPYELKLVPYFH